MKELSVILPCYNEQENIKWIPSELIKELDKLKIDYEIIAVNDGSIDNTYKELIEIQKKFPVIKIVNHGKNMGLASAIKTGIDNVTGRLTVTLDADFTFHPRQIKNLLERFKQEDVDVVIGSPGLKMGYSDDIPKYRIMLSKGGGLLYKMVLGKKINAVTPIFRLYRTEYLKEIELNPVPSPMGGFGINAEILAKLLIKNRRVVEIPAELTTRQYGESKINNSKEIVRQLILLTKIIWWRINSK
jgi:dolichol-phosphate mannosyltransferase